MTATRSVPSQKLVYIFFGEMWLPSGKVIRVRIDSHTEEIDPGQLYEHVFDISTSNRHVNPIEALGISIQKPQFSHARPYLTD